MRILWAALALAACAHAPARPEFPIPEDAEVAPRPAPPRPPDRLTRAALDRTLAAGPGAFLGTVRLRAVTGGGRFVGWEILDLDPRYAPAGLHPGDVVRRVNGRPVERPDDLAALWQTLRQATELEFDVRRGGEDAVVRVPVAEE